MRLTEKPNKEYDLYHIKEQETEYQEDCDFTEALEKLGQLEDIEDRLSRFSDIGIDGLITLFKNLNEDDLEFIVQRAFKSRRVLWSQD